MLDAGFWMLDPGRRRDEISREVLEPAA